LSRLVVVSNRVAVPTDGPAQAGGLAVALREALQENGGIWFGWSGKTSPKPEDEPAMTEVAPVTYATLDLSRRDHREYYNGFANRALWPLFHYRLDLADFNRQDYAGYLRVNTHFAERLRPLIRDDDDLWVHDYHLIPFASELRRLGVENRIGFFLHTPFPTMEILLALPSHDRLARSLCAYDVLGFQTINDLRAFHEYIVHEAGGEILDDNMVRAFGRTLKAEVYPIGIEVETMQRTSAHAMQEPAVRRLVKHMGERSLVIGVDRLDYSKGIPERFRSFERFLEKFPAQQGKVSLMQIAPVSRGEVPEYKNIREELEALAGHINGVYGELDWMPIRYLNKGFPRDTLTGFYRTCRVGLVTPLRDGMNLVAKEYVASQNPHEPGVLVLSRFAGAARELDAAVQVNPYDQDNVAEALNRALSMSLEERRERWESMMERVQDSSLDKWRERFLDVLRSVPHGGFGQAG
jgi:trehalose 6-phosphate synthase